MTGKHLLTEHHPRPHETTRPLATHHSTLQQHEINHEAAQPLPQHEAGRPLLQHEAAQSLVQHEAVQPLLQQTTVSPPPAAAGQEGPQPAAAGQEGPQPTAAGQEGPQPAVAGQEGPQPTAAGQKGPQPAAVGQESDRDDQPVVLTPDMEVEILGPESFTWCGLGCLRGAGLQRLARPEIYLLIFSCIALGQGTFFVYSSGILTTVERRFNLPSTLSSIIYTGNDMLQIVWLLHLAFVSGYGHRPRWLTGGLILSVLGCLLCAAPHFVFGSGDYIHLDLEMLDYENDTSTKQKDWAWCGRKGGVEEVCQQSSEDLNTVQYSVAAMQFFGQLFTGIASSSFHVVGHSYLDESVTKEKVPLYFAVSGCMRIFGPVTGMALASWALRIWVDPTVTPTITPTHPRWVGAWWLGYLVILVMILVTSAGTVLLPRVLPGTRARSLAMLQAAARQGRAAFTTYRHTLRPLKRPGFINMLPGLRRLARNNIFITLTANQVFFWLAMGGRHLFQGKYMEHQFKIAAADANKYMALVEVVASFVGWLGMGLVLTLIKPRTKVILFITIGISLTIVLVNLAQMAIKCEREEIQGLSQVLHNTTAQDPTGNAEVTECIAECGCSGGFFPVCVGGEHAFFSACHAGCTHQYQANGSQVYAGCSCASLLESTAVESKEEEKRRGEAVKGKCASSCDNLWQYLALFLFNSMMVAANRVIVNIIFFRSVTERDKDLSLGFLTMVSSAAFMLSTVLVGVVIDHYCLLWENTCGRRGFCHLYDMDVYRYFLHGFTAASVLVGFLFQCLLFKWHRDLDFFGHKETQELGLPILLKMKMKKKKKETRELQPTEGN